MTPVQLYTTVLNRIGREIVVGTRPVGSVLTLASIQEQFDVSRTVAREIMRSLESLGLVVARRRVGMTVRPRTEWRALDPRVIGWRLGAGDPRVLLELAELRAAVQPAAAELAARQATRGQRARLVELGDAIAAAVRSPGLGRPVEELEREFHSLLLGASGNDLFTGMPDIFGFLPVEPGRDWADRYRRIAHAIATGNGEMARVGSRAQAAQALALLANRTMPTPASSEGSVDDWSV